MNRALSITFTALFLFTTACQQAYISATPTPDTSYYAVNPIFREFYSHLGGREILGDAISETFESDGKQFQYILTGLMIFDPQAPLIKRFQLAPLGRQLGIGVPTNPNISVAEPFKVMYTKLGRTFVGQPLTSLVYNSGQNRYEQYFENVGFYHGAQSSGYVRLLPYGAWVCDAECRSSQPRNSILEFPTPTSASSSGSPTLTAPSRHELSLLVQESFPLNPPDQVQQIEVEIQDNDSPLVGAWLDLVLSLPNGAQKVMPFPPTGRDGKTRLYIQPFSAPNGTLVSYKVCVTLQSGDAYCVRGSYLIWDKP